MGYPFRSRLEAEAGGDVAVIQMKDIDEANSVRVDQATRLSLRDIKHHHWLQKGDLLFRSRGRSNQAALVTDLSRKAVLAAPLLLIRPGATLLPGYLHWFLNAPGTQSQIATLARGTAVQMVSAESLKTLPIPVPPLERQHKIAAAASLVRREQTLMETIATRRQRVAAAQLMTLARTE